jgi:hypothetical protein
MAIDIEQHYLVLCRSGSKGTFWVEFARHFAHLIEFALSGNGVVYTDSKRHQHQPNNCPGQQHHALGSAVQRLRKDHAA